ncbi:MULTISPECIES: sce7725 family protein [Pseudomonas]|uniref:sce7725 family protein n=1 Tax=Pseudomonas TaxID=286 RepID=UPI000FFEE29E|nr:MULTISPECIES: sce7725 family protein [Pseudomonas]MCK9707700.1 sce7725 family protein [Pseudomonas syringae pv. syringae]MCK9778635.1 sce7725 family protein [Pseudomonas syringae pv. syringae]RXF66337.1 ATP-binding protein [Pseudomonas syringae]TFZ35539.1 ATP-binding protein [Pseudomonas syringae]
MYYPYFRGKQFDLLTIKESADILAKSGTVSIIEPVRESLSGLKRTIEALSASGAEAVLIVNPSYGDHTESSNAIQAFVTEEIKAHKNVSVGVLLTDQADTAEVLKICKTYPNHILYFIHFGFTEPKTLAEVTQNWNRRILHVFAEEYCGKLYQKHFSDKTRVLLRNGFKRQANRKYPDVEPFSDLHATYQDEGVDGFGDFLIVGDEYSESGGPAYAVAIHLTFIDPEMDDAMYIYHFKSDRQDTPTDPAGKFYEALTKLIAKIEEPESKILRTSAVKEFIDLYKRKHFPGLGYIKKLSMKHHIEVIADFLG